MSQPAESRRSSAASQATWRGAPPSLNRSDSGTSSTANFRFSYFPAPPTSTLFPDAISERSERSSPASAAGSGPVPWEAGSISRPVSLRISPTHSFRSHSPSSNGSNNTNNNQNSNPNLPPTTMSAIYKDLAMFSTRSPTDAASVRSSVRSDITIEDLRARTSVITEFLSHSPLASPRATSPASRATSPNSHELFFDPTRVSPPPAPPPSPPEKRSRPRPPPLVMPPFRDRGPPPAPPPLSPLPQLPAPATPTNSGYPRQLHRFSGVSGVYEFTLSSAEARRSSSSLNTPTAGSVGATTGSHGHEHAVVTRASVLPVLGDSMTSVVPMAVAPATYRDAATALDLSRRSLPAPPNSGREELYRGAFVMSEQSLAYNSPIASTTAQSEFYDAPPMPTPAPPVPPLPVPAQPKSRPLSMQRPPSISTVRSAGAQIAASFRRFAWGRRRPGTANTMTNTNNNPDRELGLPDLAMRAEMLGDMLAEGRLPHHSVTSLPLDAVSPGPATDAAAPGHPTGARSSSLGCMRSRYGRLPQDIPPAPKSAPWHAHRPRTPKRMTLAITSTFAGVASRVNPFSDPPEHRRNASVPLQERRLLIVPRRRLVRWIIVAVVSILVILAILLGVLLTLRPDDDDTATLCEGNLTGALCNMDATCVCTSGDSCMPVAQALVPVLSAMNRNFNLAVTLPDIALTMWDLTGVHVGTCAAHANLIDVGAGLNGITFPNHTLWAQSALLYSLHRSQDLESVATMRHFIASANFTVLSSDGPVSGYSDRFGMSTLGYAFDFAAMTAVAPVTSFEDDAHPAAEQLNALPVAARDTLDNVYTFAKASATQRSVALSKYWTAELQLPESSLASFIKAMQTAPVLLPFDATFSTTSAGMEDLFASSSTLSVPPPAACYPRANFTDLQIITDFEQRAFGFPELTAANTAWNTSCIAERPVYGVLNPLHLRTPFLTTAQHPGQAVALEQPPKYRAIYHLGDILASFPFDHPRSDLTLDFIGPREFGTVDHLHHILLSYLQAMPTVKLAATAAQFIIDAASSPWSSPPPSTSALFDVAAQLPVIGVAFFGTLSPSDVSSFYSDFSSPSGSLFFGSDVGSKFRSWALDVVSAPISWANGSLSAQFVKDEKEDTTFDEVWDAAAQLIAAGPTGSDALATVVQMFSRDLYFES
ncbi:hypothetical protein EXIGLDRAFT_767400 [Exidia glandulosa HHB12029]|uniref:Uncharacterized protein n=1 Tax=Exidia glandulosa HHB12029 TaxID=1314781 RepID=A0A165IZN6_EXIGL|nr:hypothetical protein EXIGLDRAFT_767400 [Exidia glandulosa HHB12029]